MGLDHSWHNRLCKCIRCHRARSRVKKMMKARRTDTGTPTLSSALMRVHRHQQRASVETQRQTRRPALTKTTTGASATLGLTSSSRHSSASSGASGSHGFITSMHSSSASSSVCLRTTLKDKGAECQAPAAAASS